MQETILAIDDEKMNREFYCGLLQDKGYDVLKAENGEDALDILRKESVDLVLLDVMMPGISGFDVLKSIRENKKLQSLPVIIITGLADKENRLKGLQLGADDFITKPFDVDELLVKVSSQIKLASLRNQIFEKRKLLNIVNRLDEGIIITDNNFLPIVTNAKAKDILGMKEDPENILTHFKKMFKKDIYPHHNSNYFIVKSQDAGKPGIFSLNVQPVKDASDDVDSYVFIIRDITSNAAILFDWNEGPEPFRLE
ncbi:MAG TPA: response regulator [Deltaproteobacteria bacterium]|nr:response regulator [Deltaproteobacteria bacterium]